MAIHITGHAMTVRIGNRVVASARFTGHATADGNGAWIISAHPARLFTRDQAIIALTVAELGESGRMRHHRPRPSSGRCEPGTPRATASGR